MSHTQKLNQLQKEIQLIYSRKKKKRLKPHQKTMLDFINGATKEGDWIVSFYKKS